MSSNKKFQQITSPSGTALFPWLHKPDTKFNPDGEYGVKLVLPAKAKETKEYLAALDDAYDLAIAAAREEMETKKGAAAAKKLKLADKPYSIEEDEETGKPTGNVRINFKLKAKVTSKKDGQVYEQHPHIFDAKGKIVADVPNIGSGSTIKTSAFIIPFYTAQVGAGITLRLRAVQLLELVEFGASANASGYGFAEEEGYEAAITETAAPRQSQSGEVNSDGAEEEGEEVVDF